MTRWHLVLLWLLSGVQEEKVLNLLSCGVTGTRKKLSALESAVIFLDEKSVSQNADRMICNQEQDMRVVCMSGQGH